MGAFERPFSMRGITTKIKSPHGSMFVTINFLIEKPSEIFVVVSKPGSELRACAEALGRVVSLALQKGLPIEDIIETLENIKTEDVAWNHIDGKSFTVSSIPDGIAKAIKFATSLRTTPDTLHRSKQKYEETEMKTEMLNEKNNNKDNRKTATTKEKGKKEGQTGFEFCPKCETSSLIFQEGCWICMNCGFTKC